ncbi:hypothetical protein, partial [Bacteroides heparinolyticus]|uniref:hypothetical protein n=1 Tax=Prevotella heparinolytica TaxID=28113 RepID=UPI0035A07AF8
IIKKRLKQVEGALFSSDEGGRRIYEADNVVYARQAVSHIRGRQRHIYEAGSVAYTRQTTSRIRSMMRLHSETCDDTAVKHAMTPQ